jgi:hypothetical protein
MATANPTWGAPRVHGELKKLGFKISERTVSRLMPKKTGTPSQTWMTFFRNHVGQMVSVDFFGSDDTTPCYTSSLSLPMSVDVFCISMSRNTQALLGRHIRSWRHFRTTPCQATWYVIVMGFTAVFSRHESMDWVSDKFSFCPVSLAELLCGTGYRKYSPRMPEPRDRDQRVASAPNSEKLLFLLPSVEDASVVGQGCPGVPPRSGSTGWQDHSNPGSRRTAPSVRAPGRMRWAIHLIQSIADFFYLSWHLLRSLFMSQEALQREIAEMRL